MGITIALLSFLALLFGMMLLILVCGMQTREQERALEVESWPAQAHDALGQPSFFGPLATAQAQPDPEVLRSLELHLRTEREAADGFVVEPSLVQLYRDDEEERRSTVESLTGQVERFLGRELAAVSAFVREPSAERLHVLTEPLALAS